MINPLLVSLGTAMVISIRKVAPVSPITVMIGKPTCLAVGKLESTKLENEPLPWVACL